MTRKKRRMYIIGLGLLALGSAAALVLTAMGDKLVYFHSPTEIAEQKITDDRRFRLGGLVEEGSVVMQGETVSFRITDLTSAVPVTYTGILPDLFREGQGVVTEGRLSANGVFTAEEVLAKHDENYMPKEVADALKKSGQWKPEEGQ